MRNLQLLLVFLFWPASSSGTDTSVDCPPVEYYDSIYHLDSACDKKAQNRYVDSLQKGYQQKVIQEKGIYHVPDKLTRTCPSEVIDLFQHFGVHASDSTYHYGYSTIWIVHNQANVPVVISWIDRTKKYQSNNSDSYYYHEVSAFDGTTSPPHHDPKAILQPNEWRSINTYDGHVFHARELLPDNTLGRVLLQHRVGLIPITNVHGHALDQFCDPNDPDIEPMVTVGDHQELAPEFKRSLRPPLRPCNTQDIGFRNLVGCPLNVYYAGMYNTTTSNPIPQGEDCSFTPKTCHEQFKFHLGKNPFSSNFHWDWDSQTKFEGTYVGHNFVFRLQAKDEIVVDTVTVAPTFVVDCEDRNEDDSDRDGFLLSVQQQERQKSVPGESPSSQRSQQPPAKLRGNPVSSSPPKSVYDDEEF